jgi:hypothetical protein
LVLLIFGHDSRSVRVSMLAFTLLKRLCQFGVVVNGGGFAASLEEFFKAWGNLFPDVVRSKSRRQCETNPTGIAVN